MWIPSCMNASQVPWLQLPGQQNILVQALFTESDYAIRVTDLGTVWAEDLSRRAIKARAQETRCPVDVETDLPGLLERLQNALTVDSKHVKIYLRREGHRLSLSTRETRAGQDALSWHFELSALPREAVACGLTLSLFSMVSFYQRGVASLLELAEDKDTVIEQLNELCKSANITFKPNRRTRAFKKFVEADWLEASRGKAEQDAQNSQEVIDELSLVGREPDFRKDWRAVLSKAGDWSVKFLPDTAERTPGRVTSTKKAKKGTAVQAKGLPSLGKKETSDQTADFQSPETVRIREKKKMYVLIRIDVGCDSLTRCLDTQNGRVLSPLRSVPRLDPTKGRGVRVLRRSLGGP